MPDEKYYERQHLKNLLQKEEEIRKLYENAIHQVTIGFSQIIWDGRVFRLKDYPSLLKRINTQITKLHAEIYAATVNGIQASWDFSNLKNNLLVDKRLAGKTPSARGIKILYDPNKQALDAFTRRKEKGINLSERVWNALDVYKTEMETAIGVAVSEGRAANELAGDLKKYLNNPDKLFRRVRQNDGSLKLSKAAQNFHPGQGVYRSSFQNARRLAATETNAAYRSADIERWRHLPFVVAYRIHLSKNHPEYDICDTLAGVYPLSFDWTAWHPHCRCYITAEQLSEKEYDKFEDAILEGKEININKLEKVPAAFTKYVAKNAERISGWKSKPYWVLDNPEFVNI